MPARFKPCDSLKNKDLMALPEAPSGWQEERREFLRAMADGNPQFFPQKS
jgi:hypothetical protein